MKKVTITMTHTVTDEFYEHEMVELVNDIKSGKVQRELKKGEPDIKKITTIVVVESV